MTPLPLPTPDQPQTRYEVLDLDGQSSLGVIVIHLKARYGSRIEALEKAGPAPQP